MTRTFFVSIAIVCATVTGVSAQKSQKDSEKQKAAAAENYDLQFARFLEEARAQREHSADSSAWMNSLMLDTRARNVNDLVTVRVEENTSATGTADASLGKTGKAGVGVSKIAGIETKLPSAIDPTNLIAAGHETSFKGGGTTTRAGVLTTMVTARVSEVLPSGDLVLEAVKEIEINGDRQIVVLTGVARRADIAAGNVISSMSLGELRIRYFGRGLMKDSLSPGWLIRALNKIF